MKKNKKSKNIDWFLRNNQNSEYAIEIENLYFRYHLNSENILKNISLKLKKHQYICVIGHNGSGKSTLSKLLIGVLTPQKGQIKIFGNLLTRNSIRYIRHFLGIVFQNPDNQFIGSTVAEDIAFGLSNRQVPTNKMQKIVVDSAKEVGMEKFLNFEPLMLSGGQKQKVAVASAIALNAKILIFDEATTMLDPKGKTEIKKLMYDLCKKQNKTIISITHDMDEILNADLVAVLNDGKLLKLDTPHEILKDSSFLKSIKLDIPFLYQLKEQLSKKLAINFYDCNSEEQIIEKLWSLKK